MLKRARELLLLHFVRAYACVFVCEQPPRHCRNVSLHHRRRLFIINYVPEEEAASAQRAAKRNWKLTDCTWTESAYCFCSLSATELQSIYNSSNVIFLTLDCNKVESSYMINDMVQALQEYLKRVAY
jgi:hypothetical protein